MGGNPWKIFYLARLVSGELGKELNVCEHQMEESKKKLTRLRTNKGEFDSILKVRKEDDALQERRNKLIEDLRVWEDIRGAAKDGVRDMEEHEQWKKWAEDVSVLGVEKSVFRRLRRSPRLRISLPD